MKTLVIGAGSIGARHLENAAEFMRMRGGNAAETVAVFDRNAEKGKKAAAQAAASCFETLEDALSWEPSHVIIAAPHKSHIPLAQECLSAATHIMIEKPVSHSADGVQDFLDIASQQKKEVFVVCNMRFHPAIKTIHENLARVGNVMFARAHYGNYLPNMRPNADYKALYCAHKDQGGGVIFDSIHEIDYLSWLFGQVQSVMCSAAKRSNLDIDVEDYAALIVQHETGVSSSIHLDYLQQCKRRGCEIIGADGTLIWCSEGKNPEKCHVWLFETSTQEWQTLLSHDDLDSVSMYKDMMQCFLGGQTGKLLDGTGGLRTLEVALAAHQSAEEKREITV